MPTSLKDLKNLLLNNGYSEEELKGKRRKTLQQLANDIQSASAVMDSVETNEASPTVSNSTEKTPPTTDDPKWTEYVMSLFDDNELDEGMPRVDSLRRVAEKVFGRFSSYSDVIAAPNLDNNFKAVVKVSIHFDGGWVTESVADVSVDNTTRDYAIHSVATAESRAESRALRKALRLVKVLSAEELQNNADPVTNSDTPASKQMLDALSVMCQSAGVDLLKTAVDSGFNITDPSELTKAQALKVSNRITNFRTKKEEIPESIVRE